MNEKTRGAALAALVRRVSEALDPGHQGMEWPEPEAWDGRPGAVQLADLLVLVEARVLDDYGEARPEWEALAAEIRAALAGAEPERSEDLMIRIDNCTPHSLVVCDEDDRPLVTLPPSGVVVRVAVTREQAGVLGGIPIFRTTTGPLVGLPEPQPGAYFVCSLIAAQAAWAVGRRDVLAPGELVRDAAGQPIGCRGLTGPSAD
jgi:hypothetical protein